MPIRPTATVPGWSLTKTFGSFRISLDNETLLRGDTEVALSPRAFQVLRHLVLHAGRLVPQEELLQALWPATYVQPDVLRTYVRDLRRALDDDPAAPKFIETKARRGYRFVAPVTDDLPQPESSAKSAEPPFVGRERELAQLGRALDSTAKGARQLVVLKGDAGIGKTTLIERFLMGASAQASSLVARCPAPITGSETAGRCATLRDVLTQWLAGQPPGVHRLVSRYAPALVAGTRGELALSDRIRQLGTTLDALAERRPLVMVIEDVQWLDPAACAWFQAFATSPARARLLLLCSMRTADAIRHSPAILRTLADLAARGFCHDIELGGLDGHEVETYLNAFFPADWNRNGLTTAVLRRADGHPQLTAEVTATVLGRRAGLADLERVIGETAGCVPPSVRAGLDVRLDRLDDLARQVLIAASVVGPTFSVAPVAAGLQAAESVVEDACQALALSGDLIRDASPASYPSRYQFVHAIHRDAIYAGVATTTRATLHRRIGEWLVDSAEGRPYSDEATNHLERGGEWVHAVDGLSFVATSARRRSSWGDAAQAVRRALDILGRRPGRERVSMQASLLESLGMIELMSGAPQQAMTTYDALASAAERNRTPEVQVRALLHLGYPASLVSAPQALRAVEQAQALLSDVSDPLARDRAGMRAAFLRVWSGRWSTAERDRFRRTLDGLNDRVDGAVAAFHLADYSYLQWLSSDYQEGRHNAEKALMLLERGDDVLQLLNAQLFLVWQLLFLGEWEQALIALDNAQSTAERSAYEPRAKAIPLFRAWLSLHACDFSGARALCRLALPHYLQHPDVGAGLRICLILAGCAESELGSARQARRLFSQAELHMLRRPMNMDWYWRMQLELGRADLALRERHPAAARRHADELLSLTGATVERTWQALAWDASARVALAAQEGKRAEGHADTALRLVDAYDLPLAAWRVYNTAAAARAFCGRDNAARRFRSRSRSAALRLAGSLDVSSPLRATFMGRSTAAKTAAIA